MIGSAIAADLVETFFSIFSECSNNNRSINFYSQAKNPKLKGNKKALSTVSGIIEGSGSLTAAIVQKILPFMKSQIFVFFMCKHIYNLP